MNYNLDNDKDIDLNDTSLFEYVLELDELQKSINGVGPSNPDKFGSIEQFGQKKKKIPHLTLFICILVILIVIAYLLLGPFSCNGNEMPSVPRIRYNQSHYFLNRN